MGQLGFFDADKRLAALSAKGDPLEAIDRLVPWESFRGDRGRGFDAGGRAQEHGRSEADRCDRVVPNADLAVAVQSLGRTGRISGA